MTEVLLIVFFFIFLYRLISQIGKSFPLFELVIVLYLLQYGIAPLLEYDIDPLNTMSVSKNEYLPFAVWSCLAFALGLFSLQRKFKKVKINISSDLASVMGRTLLIIAVFGNIAVFALPYSFRAIFNFFIILQFPAVYCLVFSDHKIDKLFTLVFFMFVAITSILNAGLIEFVVFSIFFSMFYSFKYTITNKVKITIFIVGFLFISVYQSVKLEYRSLIWEEDKSWQSSADWQTKVAILTDLVNFDSFVEAFSADVQNNASIIQTVHRLNQGWQTSMVLAHVPQYVPFENGKALKVDLLSSFMPRFLLPNKRVVNDNDRYNYYTGYILNDQTSMSMGVLGDFYINFGFYGTMFSLFVFGFVMARLLLWFYQKFIYDNPINLVWLPFIFSYFIRPGNEFYMVFNHIIKSLVIFYIIKRFLYPYIRKTLANKAFSIET